MKLSISDFNFQTSFYEPKSHILKAITDEKYRRIIDRDGCCNWIFNVTKKTVFDYLGWRPCDDTALYWDDVSDTELQNLYFPEFRTEEMALMFLITTIILHNETIDG